MNLGKSIVLDLVQAGLADGTTDPDSSSVDMQGFEGVMFVGIIGAQDAAATAAIQAAGSTDDSTFADITGALATSPVNSDDKILVLDVYRPQDRYIRTTLTRAGTTNTTWGGTLAIRYGAHNKPTTHTAATLAVAMATVIGGA